jgi:hypothetical protein
MAGSVESCIRLFVVLVSDLPQRRAVSAQAVGDDDLRTAIALYGFGGESQCAGLVPPPTDEELQHLALVIDCRPKIMKLAVDLHENLVGAPAPGAEVAALTGLLRISPANSGPKRFHQNLTVSSQMSMPRICSRSLTSLKDKGKRTYIVTAGQITSELK